VFLKTDHRGYYAEALGVESRGMRVVSQSADYWNDRDVLAGASRRHFAGRQTLFEKRFVRKGKPIYYVEWGKATPR
jgi:tRNA G46 methylase TrmB